MKTYSCIELRSTRAPIFKVLYPPNPSFTGRTEILTTIHNRLVVNAKPKLTESYALYGLGGVGKTQIAIQYAYLHRTDFDIMCWLRANDWNTLVTSYVELSRDLDLAVLGVPVFEDGLENVVIAERIKLWFQQESTLKWLLIFDNADRIDDPNETRSVIELVPRGENGCILTTSRNRASDGELASVGCEVKEMMETDAVEFLLRCSRKDKLESQEQDAKNLVRELGYLPLAIEQVGSYVREKGISVSRYFSFYKTNQSNALKQRLPMCHNVYYRHTVVTTWRISFDEIETRNPLAGEILCLMAFLDGAKIQRAIFEVGGQSLSSEWKLSNATVWNIGEALGFLQSYSLVRTLESDDLWIHILVQQVIQEHILLFRNHFSGAALSLIRVWFPWGGDLENLSLCREYIFQAKVCIKNNSEIGTYSNDLALLAGSVGAYFQSDGQYDEVIAQYKRALKVNEKAFGVGHINTANTINNLGLIYDSQGKYDESIAQYERALRIYEKTFGVDHINTAATISNMGSTYDGQGKHDEAIAQYKRALRIYEKAFGVDHINAAGTIMNISLLLNEVKPNSQNSSCHEPTIYSTLTWEKVIHVHKGLYFTS